MLRRHQFVLGAFGGAALDQIHVRTGVLSYRQQTRLDQPWWVAPQFGVATIAMLQGARLLAGRSRAPSRARVVADAAWFVASYCASGLLDQRRPRALAAALVVCAAARIARRKDRGVVAAYAVVLAAAGSAYEHVLSGTGAFSYACPELGNIPAWLPGLYLQGAPLAIDLAGSLVDRSATA